MTKAKKLLIGIPVATIALATVLGWHFNSSAHEQYEEDLRQLRAMGVATTPDDLFALDTGDPVTGDTYRDLYAQYKSLSGNPGKMLDEFALWPKSSPPVDPAPYRRFFASLIAPLEQNAARPTVSFERNWRQDPHMIAFPEYAEIKGLARIVYAEGIARARERNLDGTIRSIKTLDGMSAHAASEPTLIAGLVGLAIDAFGFALKAEALEQFQNDPTALTRLRDAFENRRPFPTFRHALSGEVVGGLTLLDSPTSLKYALDPHTSGPGNLTAQLNDWRPVRDRAKRKLAGIWRQVYDSWPSDEQDYAGIERVMQVAEAEVNKDGSIPGQLVAQLFPVFASASQAFMARDARDQVAKLGVRLAQLRLQNGSYPKDLSQFGDLAVDPASGKPFVYKPSQTGFILYGLGQNRKDDGGVKDTRGRDDIVLEVGTP